MPVTRSRWLTAALAASALLLAQFGCGSAGSQGPAARTGPPLGSILEDEAHLRTDPSGTLALMRQLGVERMRVYVSWQALAPGAGGSRAPANFNAADPSAYPAAAWGVYDQIVRAAQQRGVGLDLTIGGPVPRWAIGPGAPRSPYASWKPSAGAFGAFVHAVATRYSGRFKIPGTAAPLPRVSFWSIWNEPNYGPDLAPQATVHSTVEVAPRLYRDLLDSAWSALHATGHGTDTILIGETAPRGITTGDNPGNFSGMVPLRFVRALYCVGSDLRPLRGAAATARGCPAGGASPAFAQAHPALFAAGGFADHPYPQGGTPPNATTPDEPDYADMGALPRLEQTLDGARAAYGHYPALPIFSTEFGYQTDPPEKIARTTPPALAALYLNWSEYLSWHDARIRSYDQFLLSDPPNAGASGGFATGLRFKDGRPKATFDAFRLPVYLPPRGRRGGSVEVWGCARPVLYARPAHGSLHAVEIQVRQGRGAGFRTVARTRRIDPRGYFDLRVPLSASAQLRVQWQLPGGAVLHSRLATARTG